MGATKYTAASFPIGQKQAENSDFTGQSAQLGTTVTGPAGEKYRLVRLNNASGLTAANAAKKCFEYTSNNTTYDVNVCADATDIVCGVAVADQVALDDNDHFWLQVDGRFTIVDSGSGVTADDLLQAAATGDAVTDASVAVADLASGSTFARALATAAADADITAVFLREVGK